MNGHLTELTDKLTIVKGMFCVRLQMSTTLGLIPYAKGVCVKRRTLSYNRVTMSQFAGCWASRERYFEIWGQDGLAR